MNDKKRLIALVVAAIFIASALLTLIPVGIQGESTDYVKNSPTTVNYFDTGDNVTVMDLNVTSEFSNTTVNNITIKNTGTLEDVAQEDVELLLYNDTGELNKTLNATDKDGQTYYWTNLEFNATYYNGTIRTSNDNFTLVLNITAPSSQGTWKTSVSEIEYYNTSDTTQQTTWQPDLLFTKQVVNPLSVVQETVIYQATEDVDGEILGGDNTYFNYTILAPNGALLSNGSTNNGVFNDRVDFDRMDGNSYEAEYTVAIARDYQPNATNYEDKFTIQQELDFTFDQEANQPFTFDDSLTFSGKLTDADGNPISNYTVRLNNSDGVYKSKSTLSDGTFKFTVAITDHQDGWSLGTEDGSYYEYFDISTQPLEDLEVNVNPSKAQPAYLGDTEVNITIPNKNDSKYGLINVTGVDWENGTFPLTDEVTDSGDYVVDYKNDSNGDAEWILFNDSNDDGVVTFNATANSTTSMNVEVKYEDTRIKTPGAATAENWTANYDREGVSTDALTFEDPDDINIIGDVIVYDNATWNETAGDLEVVPINTSPLRTSNGNFYGQAFENLTDYYLNFTLKYGDGDYITAGESGLQKVEIEGAGADVTYSYDGKLTNFNDTGGANFSIPFTPTKDGQVTITAVVNVSEDPGEEDLKTITLISEREVQGLTAELLVNGETKDSVEYGVSGTLTAEIAKEGTEVNNGLVILSQEGEGIYYKKIDARTALVSDGSYDFNLSESLWNNVTANKPLEFTAYWFEDEDNNDTLELDEVSLAVNKEFEVTPSDVYDIEVEPSTLTAGVSTSNLTLTITEDGEPVTDIYENATPKVDGVNYFSNLTKVNASNGTYKLTGGFLYNETGTHEIEVSRNDSTKVGYGSFDVELPTVEFEVETFNPRNMSESQVFGEDFVLTAGVNRTYNITVTAYDVNGELLNGTNASIMLGYINETGFQNVTNGALSLDENGSVEFEFTPEMADDFVWKVGDYYGVNVTNDSQMALVEEPPVMAEQPNLRVLDRAGGEIPDMSLPLGYETELLIIAQQADARDYLFSSFTVKAEGSIAETNATATTEAQDDPTGVDSPAQVARLTITPTGTGIEAIQITSDRFDEAMAELNVTDTVNKLNMDFDRDVEPGDEVTLTITDTFENSVISDARVSVTGPGGTTNLVTDESGQVNFTLENAGDYEIEVRRAGYGPASDVLNVEPVAEFSYEVTASPSTVTYGEEATVTVTVTNSGGAQGSVNVPVELNEEYVTTRTVLVEADSQTTFQLTVTADQIGTNTVSIADGQATTEFTVEKQTVEEALTVTGPATATVGETVTLTVTADGSPVQAEVTMDGTTKTTDSSGQVTFTVTEAGEVTFTATKSETETATTITTYTADTQTVTVEKEEVTKELSIVGPTEVTAGESATYLVKANGEAVEDATVEFNGETATTDSTGRVEITYQTADNYILTASKSEEETTSTVTTYTSDSISVEVVKEEITKNLQLSVQTAEENLRVDNEITFKVTDQNGEAVEDATVQANGETATTGSDGTVAFTFDEAGAIMVSASKAQTSTDTTVTTYTSTSTTVDIQQTPGFIAITAITGLLAAAFILYRKERKQ